MGPCSPVPYLCGEVLSGRLEDPSFAETLGRARALARREPYDPERHHPWRGVRRGEFRVDPAEEAALEKLLERFSARGARWRSVTPERESAVDGARHLRVI